MIATEASDMAASLRWSGFSEEDLKKIREENGLENENPAKVTSLKGKQSTLGSTGIRKVTGKKHGIVRSAPRKIVVNDAGVSVLEPSEMLSPPTVTKNEASEAKQVKLPTVEHSKASSLLDPTHNLNGLIKLRLKSDGHSVEVMQSEASDGLEKHAVKDDLPSVSSLENSMSLSSEDGSNEVSAVVQSDANAICNRKKLSLEDFQKRQKMIEEQNKRRRAMLSKAISDRKKKTQAETEKLTHIQKELQKLDCLVSNDVAILRNQIEVASLEFNDIQKRYEKAEREFVEAKMELFKKMERKEQLTEHLCTIIEENELRKAKKLAELMHELELESLIDEFQQDELVLPQLCALNDITYSYCTTLRDPKSLPVSPTEPDPSIETSAVITKEINLPLEVENNLPVTTAVECSVDGEMPDVGHNRFVNDSENNRSFDKELNENHGKGS